MVLVTICHFVRMVDLDIKLRKPYLISWFILRPFQIGNIAWPSDTSIVKRIREGLAQNNNHDGHKHNINKFIFDIVVPFNLPLISTSFSCDLLANCFSVCCHTIIM